MADNRKIFWEACAANVDGSRYCRFDIVQGTKPEVQISAVGWNLECLKHFFGNKKLGQMVLFVCSVDKHRNAWTEQEKGEYAEDPAFLVYELGLRNEFKLSWTPSYALRLIAFFHYAESLDCVKEAGLHVYFDLHPRGQGFNWQLNLCCPVCKLDSTTEPTEETPLPKEWSDAMERVAKAISALERLIQEELRQIEADELPCTPEVWRDLLVWYESNRKGRDMRCAYEVLPAELAPLCEKKISELNPEEFPPLLAFLRDTPNEPISAVRVDVTMQTNGFKQWLAAQPSIQGKDTPSSYVSALNSVVKTKDKDVDSIFEELDLRSVFDIVATEQLENFRDSLEQTEWYKKNTAKLNKKGVNSALTYYGQFLNFSALTPMDSLTTKKTKQNREEMTMTLEELLDRSDWVSLVTDSKPVSVKSPLGDAVKASWRSLYEEVWKQVWKEKKTEICRHVDMLTEKSSESYLRKPKFFFEVGEQYAVYNKYGVRNMLPKLEQLFVACGVALNQVSVRFVPVSELLHSSVTDADLNTILYGPPGTGKTFNTTAYAVAICSGLAVETVKQAAKEHYQDVKAQYDAFVKDGRIAFVTFHQSYEYGDFIEGLAPDVDEATGAVTYKVKPGAFRAFCDAVSDEPCVFIIDEINRGNISKILGELMTLIEPSKRDCQFVTLPVSGKRFTVPKNVYILGTMNTADRSLAMMDTALRRRFDFVRMDPQPELLPTDVEGVNVAEMLRVMNKRICRLCDEEHTLGHALFWSLTEKETCSLEQLGLIFRKKIIPLLQEYFHDDARKIQLVLGKCPLWKQEPDDMKTLFPGADDDLPEAPYMMLPTEDAKWQQSATYQAIYQS